MGRWRCVVYPIFDLFEKIWQKKLPVKLSVLHTNIRFGITYLSYAFQNVWCQKVGHVPIGFWTGKRVLVRFVCSSLFTINQKM